MSAFCMFCRKSVDEVVVDFEITSWAMCGPCHDKAARDLAAAVEMSER